MNADEIQKAQSLGLTSIPEPELVDTDFLFRVEHVVYAFISNKGKIIMLIHGREVLMEYSEELWTKLKTLMGQ